MGKFITYSCDFPGCEQFKKSTNNWYVAKEEIDEITFIPLTGNEDLLDGYELAAAMSERTYPILKVLCSKGCAQKTLEGFLDKISKPHPMPDHVDPIMTRIQNDAFVVGHGDNLDEPFETN